MAHPVRFVLLRPQNPENLGAAARALKNFGFDDWVLVESATEDWAAARRLAVQAEDVLSAVRTALTLDAAIADCVWAVGTTSRQRRGRTRLTAREAARLAWERAVDGPVAIVFGDERSGLTNEDLDRCHDASTLPTLQAQPSVNLAQAVLLYAYEIRMAALEAGTGRQQARPAIATDEELRAVAAALDNALTQARFLGRESGDAVRDLIATLTRARLTKKEAALWNAALRVLGKASS